MADGMLVPIKNFYDNSTLPNKRRPASFVWRGLFEDPSAAIVGGICGRERTCHHFQVKDPSPRWILRRIVVIAESKPAAERRSSRSRGNFDLWSHLRPKDHDFPRQVARENRMKPSIGIVRRLVLVATALLIVALASGGLVAQTSSSKPLRRVLVLYSDERLLPANIIADEAIRATFAAESKRPHRVSQRIPRRVPISRRGAAAASAGFLAG